MVYHIEVLATDILLVIMNQCTKSFCSAVRETEESFTLFAQENQFLLKGTSGVHLFSQQKL